VYLAPRYATAIRMHEPINSVVVGDPASFSAEHSEQEPNLVFVKPITMKPAQTNLLISTARGQQASLLLISRGQLRGEKQPRGRLRAALQAGGTISDRASRVSNRAGSAACSGVISSFGSKTTPGSMRVISRGVLHVSRALARFT
jgi:hypothetical protein